MISYCLSLPWAGWVYTSFLFLSSSLLSHSRCLGPVLFVSHLSTALVSHLSPKLFTLLTSHYFLHTPNLVLHTLNFTLRSSYSKLKFYTPHVTTARSNLDVAITMRTVEIDLQNTIELCTTASEIICPKPDLDARAKKKQTLFFKGFLKYEERSVECKVWSMRFGVWRK